MARRAGKPRESEEGEPKLGLRSSEGMGTHTCGRKKEGHRCAQRRGGEAEPCAHAKGKGETTDCVAAAAVLQARARSQGGKRMASAQSGSSSSDTEVTLVAVTRPGLV